MTVKCVKTICHEEGVAVSFWYRSHYNEEAWNILCSHMLCVSFEMCGKAMFCVSTSIKRMLICLTYTSYWFFCIGYQGQGMGRQLATQSLPCEWVEYTSARVGAAVLRLGLLSRNILHLDAARPSTAPSRTAACSGSAIETPWATRGILKDREGCWKDEEIGERERQIRN